MRLNTSWYVASRKAMEAKNGFLMRYPHVGVTTLSPNVLVRGYTLNSTTDTTDTYSSCAGLGDNIGGRHLGSIL